MKIIKSLLSKITWWFNQKIKVNFPIYYAGKKGLRPYVKPFLDSTNLVAKMSANGLTFSNPTHAELFLKHTNYYRFKVYLRPYLISPTSKTFIPGSSFDSSWQLYKFDEELRSFILGLTSQIEIRFRHVMDQRLTVFANDPFWYLHEEAYRSFPHETLRQLKRTFENSKEEFAIHHRKTYHSNVGGRYNFFPPFWIASEVLTLGQLHWLLKSLEKNHFALKNPSGGNELDELAKDFGAYNLSHLTKWIEYVRNLRNWCAHHSRLWNRHMALPPNMKPHLSIPVSSQHSFYSNLAMLKVMLDKQGIQSDIKLTISSLFLKYPIAKTEEAKMGFPANWDTLAFW